MFCLRDGSYDYKPYEILKETAQQVVYKSEYGRENREAKISNWARWFDTEKECVDYIRFYIIKEIRNTEAKTVYLYKSLVNLRADLETYTEKLKQL